MTAHNLVNCTIVGGHRPPLQPRKTLTEARADAIHSNQMTIGKSTLSRRGFLVATLASPLWQASDPWSEASTILGRIKPPTFPARDFNIVQFGATSSSSTDSSDAISKAIAACSSAGGGRVVV